MSSGPVDTNPACPECGTFPMSRRTTGFLSCHECGKLVVVPKVPTGDDAPSIGDTEEITVPDYTEAMVGWRAWGIDRAELDDGLTPLLRSVTWGEHVWTPREHIEAECDVGNHRPGHIPLESCTCGLYAAKTMEHLVRMNYHRYDAEARNHFHVIGTVSLWGKVIEGTQGWRAQFGYPRELYVPYEAWSLCKPLADAYGVPVRLKNILKNDVDAEV